MATEPFDCQVIYFLIMPFSRKQMKGPEFISSVLFAFGIFLREASQHWNKSLKQTRQRWQQCQVWPNQQFETFLKRKNTPVSSATLKDLRDHEKHLCSMTEQLFGEVSVCMSKSAIKRIFHQSEDRGFTTRSNPLISLKKPKDQISVLPNILSKNLYCSGTTAIGREEDQLVPESWEKRNRVKQRNIL